jgi:hypothetical protein
MTRKARANKPQDARQGLPETLKLISNEKRVKTIAAKVEPSLALYLKQHGGSTFIRTLILQSLYAISNPE